MDGFCRLRWTSPIVPILLLLLLGDQVQSGTELDPYNILGVSRSASQTDIKKVYKRLVREW